MLHFCYPGNILNIENPSDTDQPLTVLFLWWFWGADNHLKTDATGLLLLK